MLYICSKFLFNTLSARNKLLSSLKDPNTITVALRKGSDDGPAKHPGLADIFKSFSQPPTSDTRPSDEAVVLPPTPPTSAPASSVLQLTRIETEYSQKSPWSPETPVRDEILGADSDEWKEQEDMQRLSGDAGEDVIHLNSTDNNKCSMINMVLSVLLMCI